MLTKSQQIILKMQWFMHVRPATAHHILASPRRILARSRIRSSSSRENATELNDQAHPLKYLQPAVSTAGPHHFEMTVLMRVPQGWSDLGPEGFFCLHDVALG